MPEAEDLIERLVASATAKDVPGAVMAAVALGRLLEQLEPAAMASEIVPDTQRRPRRVNPSTGRPMHQTRPLDPERYAAERAAEAS